MTLNIACFVPGCKNPVIGQCPGYERNCGHFYCEEHSNGKLCGECALIEDYIRTAENLKKQTGKVAGTACSTSLLVWVSILIVGFLIISLASRLPSTVYNIVGIAVYIIIGGGILVAYSYIYLKRVSFEDAQITAINASKPGFTEFYAEWQKHKNREAMKVVLSIGLGAVAAGLAGSAEEARTRRAVDDELNRHGL